MSFLPGKHDDRDPPFQMTAMVDVVFMLLAFFVLASRFRMPERDFAMGYAESAPAARGTVAGDFPSYIPVRLQGTGGAVTITIGQARLRDNDFDGIQAKLTEINMPEIGVRILAQESLSVGQVAKALDAVLGSPMKDVSISKLEVPRARPTGSAGA